MRNIVTFLETRVPSRFQKLLVVCGGIFFALKGILNYGLSPDNLIYEMAYLPIQDIAFEYFHLYSPLFADNIFLIAELELFFSISLFVYVIRLWLKNKSSRFIAFAFCLFALQKLVSFFTLVGYGLFNSYQSGWLIYLKYLASVVLPFTLFLLALGAGPRGADDGQLSDEATRWRRFCGYVVDTVIIVLICFQGYGDGVLGRVVLLVILFCYYYFFERYWRTTPGKFLLGNRVSMKDGSPITEEALLKRSLSRLIPFEAFTFLFGEGLHDKLSKTKVENRL